MQSLGRVPHGTRTLVEQLTGSARGTGRFYVSDPATNEPFAQVADGTEREASDAVEHAADAFVAWSATPSRERSELLRRAFDLMLRDAEVLAGLVAWENGKPLADARSEITYAAEFFRWFAEEGVRVDGNYGSSPSGGSRTIVTRRPIGVAALVTPWNFPAAMATRKIAPALAAGCTIVLKPAAETPLTALAIAALLKEAGVPEGVVNVVPTTRPADVVDAWLTDARVRKLSFTGSTAVGRALLARCADRVLSTSMELGGNAPFIVGPTADLDSAVPGAMLAKFRNGGQACTAVNRFLVHADVVEEFTARLGDAVSRLRVGHALDAGTEIGPLISQHAVAGVQDWVERAVTSGGHISQQAVSPDLPGSFYPPTVVADVPGDAAVLQDEVFGPVAPIVAWADEADLMSWVNGTELGLAAYVYSRDLNWALHVAESVDAGMVGLNRGVVSDPSAPFGGLKQSGLGREGAREGLHAFMETQYFSVAW